MNAAATAARRTIRDRARAHRAAKAARRQVAAGAATMSAHLIARGLDAGLAHRFAGAVSRKAGAGLRTVKVAKKFKGRTRGLVDAKLFTVAQVTAVLAVYRPAKDQAAQRAFLALAA